MNVLSNLKINEEYSINEISEKSGLHWQTANDYLRILSHLLKFSPKIKINDNNKIEVISHSDFFERLSINQRILVTLYESKAFNEKSAIRIKKIISDPDLEIYLEELTSKEQIKKNTSEDEYFITNRGKTVVISLYSDITQDIFSFDYDIEEISQMETSKENTEKINLQNNMIINQNNEIMEQNKIIMFLLGNLVYKGERKYEKASELDLEHLTSSESIHNLINSFQKSLLLKNTFQTDQEVNIKIKRSDKVTSDYEYTEINEISKKFLDALKRKIEKKQNMEVIR